MPCNLVIQSSVRLANANLDVLTDALKSLGFEVRRVRDELHYSQGGRQGIFKNGALTALGGQPLAEGEVKQAYSKAAVKAAAVKFGWSVEQKNPAKITIQRRY